MKKYDYPETIEIQPVTKPVNAKIRVPGSKSITNRALVLGALASQQSKSKINGVLHSDDTEYMIAALRQLGFSISFSLDGQDIVIESSNRLVPVPSRYADLYLGNSGTCMRFLTAMLCLGTGEYRLDGDSRMRERPMMDLLDALGQLGVDAKSELGNGCPPIIVKANGLLGGKISIKADVSSQFLSALLMVSPLARERVEITVTTEIVSYPYVALTENIMGNFYVKNDTKSSHYFSIPGQQQYTCWRKFEIEPDASSASYFLGAAAITKGNVKAEGIYCSEVHGLPRPDRLYWGLQPDSQFVSTLVQTGCIASAELSGIVIHGKELRGITADMNWISDTVPSLAAVACFAEGPTTIRNVAHIRHKECDRITALCTELRKLGVEVEEYPDGLKITPRPMHGAVIETYNDHRMAMSMALIGLRVPGVVIKNPGCVAKTYPGFWEDFQKLYE